MSIQNEAAAGTSGRAPRESRPADVRAQLLQHSAAILWLTGLPGAGKSTLARGLERVLLEARILSVVLDGDELRHGLSKGLGFSPADRDENVRRAGEAALLLAGGGAVVIVALVSPFRSARDRVRARAGEAQVPFVEVYVNAPLAECERRDPKSLYRRARAGEIAAFTGIDSPYEPPQAPELELATDRETVGESLARLTQFARRVADTNRHDPRLVAANR